MAKNHYIIPFFVPHLGCPHDCVFCNQKSITGSEKIPTGTMVAQKIKEYLKTIPQSQVRTGLPAPGLNVEVAFYGGSFTGIPRETQALLLQPAKEAFEMGLIHGIRISTRPDYINEEILVFLKGFGVSIIELGVQSMDDEVLKLANRGHTREDVLRAVEIIKDWKSKSFRLGLQMMIGLPGDTPEKAVATARELSALQPDFVRIYPTLVLKKTFLELLFLEGEFQPLSLDQAISICAGAVKVFNEAAIPVIRIGLQPTEEIKNEDGQVLAGPFHPAFRELVEGELAKERLEALIKRVLGKDAGQKELTFLVPTRDLSIVTGQKRRNIIDLEARYDIKIKLIIEPSLTRGEIRHKN